MPSYDSLIDHFMFHISFKTNVHFPPFLDELRVYKRRKNEVQKKTINFSSRIQKSNENIENTVFTRYLTKTKTAVII